MLAANPLMPAAAMAPSAPAAGFMPANDPWSKKLRDLSQQQAVADALMQTRMPLRSRQAGRGRFQLSQAPSAFEGLANIAQTGAGAYAGAKINDQYAKIAQAMRGGA